MSPDRIVRGLNGARGSGLLAGAVIAVVHAATYFDPAQRRIISSGLRLLDEAVPLTIPAVLWAIAAGVAAVGAFRGPGGRQRDQFDAWGFALVTGLLLLWGSSYLLAYALEGLPLDRLVFGIIYCAVAVLVMAVARLTNTPTTTQLRWRRRAREAGAW